MAKEFTLEEGKKFINYDGEVLTIKSTTYAPYPALKETVNGAYTEYGWMSIDEIYNFAHN
jgi:hypothetical protein